MIYAAACPAHRRYYHPQHRPTAAHLFNCTVTFLPPVAGVSSCGLLWFFGSLVHTHIVHRCAYYLRATFAVALFCAGLVPRGWIVTHLPGYPPVPPGGPLVWLALWTYRRDPRLTPATPRRTFSVVLPPQHRSLFAVLFQFPERHRLTTAPHNLPTLRYPTYCPAFYTAPRYLGCYLAAAFCLVPDL